MSTIRRVSRPVSEESTISFSHVDCEFPITENDGHGKPTKPSESVFVAKRLLIQYTVWWRRGNVPLSVIFVVIFNRKYNFDKVNRQYNNIWVDTAKQYNCLLIISICNDHFAFCRFSDGLSDLKNNYSRHIIRIASGFRLNFFYKNNAGPITRL